MPLSTRKRAQLKALKRGGDMLAEAAIDSNKAVSMTLGAEAGNAIAITGQVVDSAGNPVAGVQNVVIDAFDGTPTATFTISTGTAKVGSGTLKLWLQTNAQGRFVVSLSDAAVEEVLVTATVSGGVPSMIVATFA